MIIERKKQKDQFPLQVLALLFPWSMSLHPLGWVSNYLRDCRKRVTFEVNGRFVVAVVRQLALAYFVSIQNSRHLLIPGCTSVYLIHGVVVSENCTFDSSSDIIAVFFQI
jgi:hypothetical protein